MISGSSPSRMTAWVFFFLFLYASSFLISPPVELPCSKNKTVQAVSLILACLLNKVLGKDCFMVVAWGGSEVLGTCFWGFASAFLIRTYLQEFVKKSVETSKLQTEVSEQEEYHFCAIQSHPARTACCWQAAVHILFYQQNHSIVEALALQ